MLNGLEFCKIKGCVEEEVIECFDFDEVTHVYCMFHARQNGYCVCCGEKQGDMENVMNSGVCLNCLDELGYEDDDYPDDKEEYYD